MTCTSRRWPRFSGRSSELAKSLIRKAKARYWTAFASERHRNRTPRFAACESASPTKIPTACSRLVLAAFFGLGLAGCEQQVRDPNRPIVARVVRGPSNEMDLWRDRETGCEYISYTGSSGLTPRLDANGRPICRNTAGGGR